MGSLVSVRRTQLNVDVSGPFGAPVLLYIHGGPGQGAYDFLAFQRERLSEDLRLVAPDQRGVLYSDPLPEGAPLSEDELVADFEALREALEIERWAILGHSFGGRIALRYAVAHPDRVVAAAFENPAWDLTTSTQKLLRMAVPMLDDPADAATARDLIARSVAMTPEIWRQRMELMGRLGDRRMELYLHPKTVAEYGTRFPSESLPDQIQGRAKTHADAIVGSAGFTESLLPLLGRLNQPALLITGATDPVTSDDQIDAFTAHGGEFVRFETSSHFPQYEEAEPYARTVREFVHRHAS